MAIKNVQFILKLKQGYSHTDAVGLEVTIEKDNTSDSQPLFSDQKGPFGGLPKADYGLTGDPKGDWNLHVSKSSIQSLPNALKVVGTVNNTQYYRINQDAVEDVYLMINYTIS